MKTTKVIQIPRTEIVNALEARIKEVGVELGYVISTASKAVPNGPYIRVNTKVKTKVFHYNRGRFEAIQADMLAYDVAINSAVFKLYQQIRDFLK